MHLLNHDANVTLTNDLGMDCIATADIVSHELQQRRQRSRNKDDMATILEWQDFIEELKRRENLEKARMEARDRARSQANEE